MHYEAFLIFNVRRVACSYLGMAAIVLTPY